MTALQKIDQESRLKWTNLNYLCRRLLLQLSFLKIHDSNAAASTPPNHAYLQHMFINKHVLCLIIC